MGLDTPYMQKVLTNSNHVMVDDIAREFHLEDFGQNYF